MTLALWFELVGFVVGLLFGSFLNVCIARVPKHQSIIHPRSRCPACRRPIRWFDNMPVLSWILLRRRCRDCNVGISWQYPAVELAVGLWFAMCAAVMCHTFAAPRPSGTPALVLAVIGIAALGFLSIGLMVMDWQTRRLPDAFTLTGMVIGFVLTCVRAGFLAPGQGDIVLNTTHQLRMSSPGSFQSMGNVFMTGTEAMVLERVAAILGAALILLLVRWVYKALRGRQGMGLGDVKLIAMIAAFLGFWGAVVALLTGVMAACVYALALLAARRATRETKLPFGSFLAAGGLIATLWASQIVGWYTGLLR